jgi:tRNA G10  N-methylase Trm11
MGFDIAPFRKDITPADARKLPLKSESIDFAFVDPPYSTHLKYSGHEQCIGELDAASPEYYEAMTKVIKELHRVLKDRRYMGLYVSDSWRKGEPFEPIGFDLFNIMRQYFKPVDIVAVVRHNKSLKHPHWHRSAEEGNYFLRGFNYLFIMKKENDLPKEGQPPERQIDSATPKK